MYKMIKILVYGTLRKGLINHNSYLRGNAPVKTFNLCNYKMYDLGGYPMVMRDKDNFKGIVVEEYNVKEMTFTKLCAMEINAGYIVSSEKIGGETYFIFTFEGNHFSSPPIPDGDYVKFSTEKYGKYTQYIDDENNEEEE